jgi:quinol monooxygenase YgiN
MSVTLTVVARVVAAEGAADTLQAEMTQLVLDTRKERGCIRYAMTRGVDDPNVFVFIEEWQTRALWEAHMQGEAIQAFRARIPDASILSSEVDTLTAIA